MRLQEYSSYDATGMAELIRRRDISVSEVYGAAVEAIGLVNPAVKAVADGPWERPLDYAPDGRFAGVPFVVKDLGAHLKGVPTRSGTRLSGSGVVFEQDSFLLSRFRKAGAAAAALSTAPEFGMNASTEALAYGGSTRNPWNLARSAGGSSGGTAVLVATGAVPFGSAGDGGGSIRIPASFNGLVGMKPSHGRVSNGPDAQSLFYGLACEFAITRTVRDCAGLLDAAAGQMPGDIVVVRDPERPWSDEVGAEPGQLKIGITTQSWSDSPVDPEVALVVEAVGRHLEQRGHHVAPATPMFVWDEFVWGMTVLMAGAVAGAVVAVSEATGNEPSDETLEATGLALYEYGRTLTVLDLAKAMDSVNRVARTVGTFFADWDLLVTPTVNVPPPPLGFHNANDPSYSPEGWTRRVFDVCSFTPLLNWSGNPAISLPLGSTADGLPIGVQLIAPICDEATLIRVGSQLEAGMSTHDRRPTVHSASDWSPASEPTVAG